MNNIARIEKTKGFWFLLLTSFLFFLLRFPSLFEPYWYGDEGIYEVIGSALRQGRLLYVDIWDNKPPLLYLVYAFFNGDQFSVKLTSLLVGICTVIVFYFLAKLLFGSRKNYITYFITLLFTVLFSTPFIEGNIANAENFMLLPTILAGIIVFYVATKNNGVKKLYFLAGLLLGISFLFKTVGFFDMTAFTLFLFYINAPIKIKKLNKEIIVKFLKSFSFLFYGFLFPILCVFLFFIAKGGFLEFLKATFTSNVGYLGYANQFIIPQGFLLIKLFILFLYCALLFIKKDKLKMNTLFVLLWLGFSLFNAYFSGRPYTHYLLVLLPSFCLFVGLFLFEKKNKIFIGILLAMLTIMLYNNFHHYNKSIPYYKNFLSYMYGKKSTAAYQSFFDKNTPYDYQLTQLIKLHVKQGDAFFLWGNNAQLYKLTNTLPPGRYTVAYHIFGNQEAENETKIAIDEKKPKYIVIMNGQQNIPYIPSAYALKYVVDKAKIYERNL